MDEQKSEAIQPLETLFNFNNFFTVFVWLPIFQPLGPKGGGAWPKWPNGEYASAVMCICST